jgi:hypothetical protein
MTPMIKLHIRPVCWCKVIFRIQTEYLEYTIRFQNTGTDTANTVVIEDQLDINLQWNSLVPFAWSHDVEIDVDYDGVATFTFENIMLADSNINEPASHGFVKFRINLKPNLSSGTIIQILQRFILIKILQLLQIQKSIPFLTAVACTMG